MKWTATDGSLDVRSLQRAYQSRELTPEALIEALYDRIEKEEHPNAWIYRVPRAEARERARALGGFPGAGESSALPLYGVPFAVKDNIDVAGMPTTAACPGFSYVPSASAPSVLAL